MSETIFALATPAGRSGVAVIRASGSKAWAGAQNLMAAKDDKKGKSLTPREASVRVLRVPKTGAVIDHALLIGFKAPASYTGEDIIEYHVHGGRAVIDGLLSALAALPNHRMAEPGEFTRRAFENGKMDLTAAEAVADLIDAQTQAQKIQALSQMEGGLSRLYNGWSDRLKRALAHVEADIEFPDEDDMAEGVAPEIIAANEALCREIEAHLNDSRRGERLRDGIQIAIIGAPNAGKSSLVNALTQRDVAIVSEIEGTTRDVIEVHLDLGGYPIILADTAGLRPDQIGTAGQDRIESEGIRRALKRAQEADIKLLLFDGTKPEPDAHSLALIDKNALIVVNKSDEGGALEVLPDALRISAKTGQGLDDLMALLIARAGDLIGRQEAPSLTRQRHRAALEEAQISLIRAQSAPLPELMAEDMRLAIRALGRITGKVDVEDLLDVIFRDFCIGK